MTKEGKELIAALRLNRTFSQYVSQHDLYAQLNLDRKKAANFIEYLLEEIEELHTAISILSENND